MTETTTQGNMVGERKHETTLAKTVTEDTGVHRYRDRLATFYPYLLFSFYFLHSPSPKAQLADLSSLTQCESNHLKFILI